MTTATEIMELISNATFTHSPKDWDATQKAIEALEAEKRAAELESNDYRATMMAAAVEIQEHWDAHCDPEGYGPVNLMRRLELGSPAGYGYTAQTVVEKDRRIEVLEAERDALKAKIAEMEKQEPVGQFDVDVEGGVSWFLKARKVYDCDKLYLAPGAKEVSPYAPVGVVVPDLKGGASINWDESFVLNPGAVLLVQANQAAKVKEQP